MLKEIEEKVKEWAREFGEAGANTKKRQILGLILGDARNLVDRLSAGLSDLRIEVSGKLEANSDMVSQYLALPLQAARDRWLRKLLIYPVVATLSLELVIGASVAPVLFWMMPVPLAVASSLAMALLLAVAAHGLAGAISDQSRPLRQRRIYRTWIKTLVIAAAATLVPIVMSRMLVIPTFVSTVAIGLCGLILPVISGVCSAYRAFLASEFIAPVERILDLQAAIAALEYAIMGWEADLSKLTEINEEQSHQKAA